MAQHKDARKRIRQTEKRRLRNKAVRTYYRGKIKSVREAVSAGDAAAAETALGEALKALDSAVVKNVLHKNTAARHKSRLSKAVGSLKSS